jgi:transposase
MAPLSLTSPQIISEEADQVFSSNDQVVAECPLIDQPWNSRKHNESGTVSKILDATYELMFQLLVSRRQRLPSLIHT